ncbi:MAG: ferredoxin like protein [Clostridiales bacterium]|jgi:ferredoxin like protein|uniref:Ferredoxin family protein n=1 Tax=Fusibacter paucivorans TaxID=76009 RepID=A0ABS5PT12_9FIRM|nr:ferredoxin family protein [Fusibacter paucivorans]MBS7528320.1 ferredoxin family protein [Fusibacter paucivorans]MDN5300424.1 ferredoxin like protein [Clostridiales bacterium]
MAKISVADKLGVNKFNVYEEKSHIVIDKQYPDAAEVDRVVRICPAALYTADANGVRFDYLGCLECGTCRVLSGGKVVTDWQYPVGSFGVSFRKS